MKTLLDRIGKCERLNNKIMHKEQAQGDRHQERLVLVYSFFTSKARVKYHCGAIYLNGGNRDGVVP